MNIFWLHEDTDTNAKYHCDKHIVKMPLETAQMLSTTVHMIGAESPNLYKVGFKNHPCTVWARERLINFMLLHNLGMALCHEYTYRYGKVHASQKVIETMDLDSITDKFLDRDFPTIRSTIKPQCMPDEYKTTNTIQAYRNYYVGEKSGFAKWKGKVNGREVPEFMLEELVNETI